MNDSQYPERRYYDKDHAQAYTRRSPKRHRAELKLLTRALTGINTKGLTLDIPCGTGRLADPLQTMGLKVVGADYSRSMLHLAGGGICADAAHLPFSDKAFPLVISHRFLHHLTPTELPATLTELARVTDRFLVVTFFHPLSLHGVKRRCRQVFSGRKSGRHTYWPADLTNTLAGTDLRPRRFLAQSPFLRELWIGVFERHTPTN